MVDVAKVGMFGMPVGIFNWDDRYGVARFEYDPSFVGRGLEPSPLMMPVREGRVYSFANLGRETFQGLPGMLADSLPDTYRIFSTLSVSAVEMGFPFASFT